MKKMVIIGNIQELHTRLKTFETQKQQLEAKIKDTPRTSKGVLNFGFYHLNKKREEIQNKIIKINSVLKPDIIA